MNRIIKVIYQDGSELEPKNITPLEISDDKQQQWRNQVRYNRQFRSFEEDILDDLDEDIVEDYAKNRFHLVEEDDVEENNINDFSDDEIIDEVRARKLLGSNNSIIPEQFITRFSKIMEKESQILLDNLLTEFETKLTL